MPAPSIVSRFEGEHVLLTGGTGFVARSVLERLLRAVPDVAGVHLLVRPRRGLDPKERVRSEVFGSALFDTLRALHGKSFDAFVRKKTSVVSGDLSLDRLGLTESTYAELAERTTLVLNLAAACSFVEPLDRALQANTLGAARVLELARDAGDVPMVHVSTCYVGGVTSGIVREEVLPPGHSIRSVQIGNGPAFDLDEEIREGLARCERARRAAPPNAPEQGDRLAAELGGWRARELGWQDTYQYSKALAEQLLVRDRGRVPLAIVRPSIIECTYKEPVPAWIDGLRMADPLLLEYARGTLPRFAGSGDNVLDLIPCDMVTHAVLAALPAVGEAGRARVYQVASGQRNPVTLGQLARWTHDAAKAMGMPASPKGPCRLVPERRIRAELRTRRWLLTAGRAVMGAFGSGASTRLAAALRSLRRAEGLIERYAPYTTTSPRFATGNTEALLAGLDDDDRTRFSFDVTRIDWREYLLEVHLPGLLGTGRAASGSPVRRRETDGRRSVPA